MRRDIGKLADRLVELGREGIAIETKISNGRPGRRVASLRLSRKPAKADHNCRDRSERVLG